MSPATVSLLDTLSGSSRLHSNYNRWFLYPGRSGNSEFPGSQDLLAAHIQRLCAVLTVQTILTCPQPLGDASLLSSSFPTVSHLYTQAPFPHPNPAHTPHLTAGSQHQHPGDGPKALLGTPNGNLPFHSTSPLS